MPDDLIIKALIAVLVLAVGVAVAARQRAIVLGGLLLSEFAIAALMSRYLQAEFADSGTPVGTVVIVKLVVACTVVAVLAVTLLWRRPAGDQPGLALDASPIAGELGGRWMNQRASRLSESFLPLATLVLGFGVAYTLKSLYLIAPSGNLSFAFFWLVVAGCFTLLLYRDAFKEGIGVLLVADSLHLLLTVGLPTAGWVVTLAAGVFLLMIGLLVAVLCGSMLEWYGATDLLDVPEGGDA